MTSANASLTDFDFVVKTVEENYSGFPDKVSSVTLNAYRSHTETHRQSFASTRDTRQRGDILISWLAFFSDRHLHLTGMTNENVSHPTEKSPSAHLWSDDVLVIRIPFFLPEAQTHIEHLISRNQAKLSQVTNLIIDLRGNGGGTDSAYEALLPYVCDGTIEIEGVDVRATEENVMYLRNLANAHDFPEDTRNHIENLATLMLENLNSFVEMTPTQVVDPGNQIPGPTKVAICIDGKCASSTEQFLIFARQGQRVTMFGENTMGCIDYSNNVTAETPSKSWSLHYPISRSKRVPLRMIDGKGIVPDVSLDANSPSMIDEVAEYLRKL